MMWLGAIPPPPSTAQCVIGSSSPAAAHEVVNRLQAVEPSGCSSYSSGERTGIQLELAHQLGRCQRMARAAAVLHDAMLELAAVAQDYSHDAGKLVREDARAVVVDDDLGALGKAPSERIAERFLGKVGLADAEAAAANERSCEYERRAELRLVWSPWPPFQVDRVAYRAPARRGRPERDTSHLLRPDAAAFDRQRRIDEGVRKVIARIRLVEDAWRVPALSQLCGHRFRAPAIAAVSVEEPKPAFQDCARAREAVGRGRSGSHRRMSGPASVELLDGPARAIGFDKAGTHAAGDGEGVRDAVRVQ